VVADIVSALGQIAHLWRSKFEIPLIAVAGSNGKTTVKKILGTILRGASTDAVLVTQGNENNEIGAPLNLLSLRE
jgi:UDP-N-acetylmuramoyl-tripeptide--D-alanyl-D-alanine ligase